jgi:HEAT repeat protein
MKTSLHLVTLFLVCNVCALPQAEKESAPTLLKKLKSQDASARVMALLEAMELGPRAETAIIPGLIAILQCPNEEEQLYATVALGNIGSAAVQDLAPLLRHEDEVVRYYAVWALGLTGRAASEARSGVLSALTDMDEDVRRKAVFALDRIGGDPGTAAAALVRLLKDQDPDVVAAAGEALGRLGRTAVPHLCEALHDPDRRPWAVGALSRMGPDAAAAVPHLLRAYRRVNLVHQSFEVVQCLETLRGLGKLAVPDLEKAARDRDPWFQRFVVRGLLATGSEGEAALSRFIAEQDRGLRRAAAFELFHSGNKAEPVVRALREDLLDDDYFVRFEAWLALAGRGHDLRSFFEESRKDRNPLVRVKAATLEMTRSRQALDYLRAQLGDPDFDVRFQAAVGLAEERQPTPKGLTTVLLEGLKSKRHTRQAANAFDRLGTLWGVNAPAAIPLLLEAVKSEDIELRISALRALGTVVPGKGPLKRRPDAATTLPSLAPLLKDPSVWVRQTLVDVLPRFGGDAFRYLAQALRDEDLGVRQRAQVGLREVAARAENRDEGALIAIVQDPALKPPVRLAGRRPRTPEEPGQSWLWAAACLMESVPDKGSLLVLKSLGTRDAIVRQALEALPGNSPRGSKIEAAMVELLSHHNFDIRRGAAYCLRELTAIPPFRGVAARLDLAPLQKHIVDQLPELAKACKSGEVNRRRQAVALIAELFPLAASRLVHFATTKEFRHIKELLDLAAADNDLEVRRHARRALSHLPPGFRP